MVSTRIKSSLIFVLVACSGFSPARGLDHNIAIKIPRRSETSPVQRLNREGVEAVRKREYDRAEGLFEKAYLYDSADPFTLNNLGYIAELKGQLDRAQHYYHLAAEQGCKAQIDVSSAKSLEGQPMRVAFESLQNGPMQVNRMNVDAVRLLSEKRGFEALDLLKKAIAIEPGNPFTLNNLGVASEAVGDYEGALRYYEEAAQTHSTEPVIVTFDPAWRGRDVSRMAAASADRLERRMSQGNATSIQAAVYNMRGVFALNQNDWETAKKDFLQAYNLDPSSAFSLNNQGYVAEKFGDLETAQFFYQKARRAQDSSAQVGLATDRSAEGKPLGVVANGSDQKVDAALDQYSRQRRNETGPIELTPRGGASLAPESPGNPAAPATPSSPAPQPPQ